MDSGEKQKNAVTTIASDSTKFYADSVEFCPLNPFRNFCVCGTYQLEDDSTKSSDQSQVRKGNITLYEVSQRSRSSKEYSLESKASVDTSGVLDMKWAPHYINEKCTFGVAFSNGCVQLQQVSSDEQNAAEFTNFCEVNVAAEDNSLALSLDWSSWKHEISPEFIIVSDSSGSLNHISLSSDGLNLLRKWKAHDYEAWIASFDYDDVNMIYSGGDDRCFKAWDLRTSLASPTFTNLSHKMGVTSVLKSRHNENLLATGSYDEHVHLWDLRMMKSPTHRASVGGGIWRIKWHPFSLNYLLVAAMHSGFHVLQLDCASCLTVAASYREHTSLAYGVDWCWSQGNYPIRDLEQEQIRTSSIQINEVKNSDEEDTEIIVASCSFYDKSLHLWSVDLPCFA